MNKIEFYKWRDPFHPGEGAKPSRRDDDTAEAADSFTNTKTAKNPLGRKSRNMYIVHPMGVFPVNSWNRPSAEYDLWVGHTNFPLTRSVGEVVMQVEGVEIYKPHSKYRFMLGVAKMFNAADVHADIRATLCSPPPMMTASQVTVAKLKKQLGAATDWAIFEQDGKLRTERAARKNDIEFRKRVGEGALCTSWQERIS